MPAYHVERSIQIDAHESQVRPAIEDFSKWPKWSPWLCMEPTAKVRVFGTPGQTDHGYDWEGDLVGAGGMKIASVDLGRLTMDLAFLRPFKSKAKVAFEIKPAGPSRTDVTWHMDGNLPFFLFFLTGSIKTMIGMDYGRGLKMLKEYVETGTVNSKTEIVGLVDVPRMHYLGVEARCAMERLGDSMKETMPAAHRYALDNRVETLGPPGALYHQFDLKQQRCHYTAIVQTRTLAAIQGVKTGTVAPCRALKVVHTGSYQHLGNAWGAAMACQRHRKLKPLKAECPFELYRNDPCKTPEPEWVTEIFLPVRG